jgi:hypothetical protein
MKIIPHNLFETNMSSFNIFDEPVFNYLLDLNKRIPDELSEEENVTNSVVI